MDHVEQLEKEIRDIKSSLSYKIGRLLTFPARKSYDFLKKMIFLEKRQSLYYAGFKNTKISPKIQPLNKNVIYTFIIGDYDDLKDPTIISEGWDYICFSDNKKLTSNIWTIVYLDERVFRNMPDCPKKRAMLIMIEHYKFIPKYYDVVISIGGQIVINVDLNLFVANNFDLRFHDLAVCKHPERDCIYDEAQVCKAIGKDDIETINKQILFYQKENYPRNNGLFMTGVLVRKNRSKQLKSICKIWALELIKGSKRDQLSFNYSIWKSKSSLAINILSPINMIGSSVNNCFIIKPHLNDIFYAQLFFTDGISNFNETNSYKRAIRLNSNVLKFEFSTDLEIKSLRFDPLNVPCIVRINEIKARYCDNSFSIICVKNSNATLSAKNSLFFEMPDSQINLLLDVNKEKISSLEITIDYILIGYDSMFIIKELLEVTSQ